MAKSPADGYTRLVGAMTSHSINAALNPATLPLDIAKSLAQVSMFGQPEVRGPLLVQGAIATWTTPDEAAAAIRSEHTKWAKLIKDGNIKVD